MVDPNCRPMISLCMLYFIRYAPRRDCGSKYEICVTLLNKKKKPVKTFAPKIIYFDSWDSQNWTQVSAKHDALINKSKMGTEVGMRLPNIYFSDYPCIPELWARSEVHQLYTWRQGQAALGTMVRDSRH